MDIKCELKKGIGKNTGKPYVALFLEYPNGSKQCLFPKDDNQRMFWEMLLENYD